MINAFTKSLNKVSKPFLIGIEREGLRVDSSGHLALTPHPPAFGVKLDNYHIKTDFCESQPELVTSPCDSVDTAYAELDSLTHTLNSEISKNNEFFWSQSMPCILPDEQLIKTAVHNGDFAKPLRDYLKLLREKYGAKLQSLCGIHYNVSISDDFFLALKENLNDTSTLKDFKNNMYMKILRNYIRHSWFVLLLTGNSPAVHESFEHTLPNLTQIQNFHLSKNATSLRSSRIGYHNAKPIKMDFTDVNSYCNSLVKGVEDGNLIDQGEFFSPIKIKAKDNVNPVKSLQKDGALYIELRNIDLNMYDKNAFAKSDMEFLLLFLIYMLTLEEIPFPNWEEISKQNSIIVAENGLDYNINLIYKNENITIKNWLNIILADMTNLNKQIKLCDEQSFASTVMRLQNPDKSYARQAYNSFLEKGFVETVMNA